MKPSSNKSTPQDPKIITDNLLEEMDSAKIYDIAKAENDEIISFDQAVKEIEAQRSDLGKSPTFGISLTRE